MPRYYEPDLTVDPSSPFVRDAANKLVRARDRRKFDQRRKESASRRSQTRTPDRSGMHSGNLATRKIAINSFECRRNASPLAATPVFDLKLNYATTGCMGNGISAPDRIELVDQRTDVELGRVDRYAKTASYCLVGQSLGEKS
jgi:hypothetical protein